MKTEEENMGKEKELLSDEELLEVAAGRGPTNLSPGQTPKEKEFEMCVSLCLNGWGKGSNDMGKCREKCKKDSNSL